LAQAAAIWPSHHLLVVEMLRSPEIGAGIICLVLSQSLVAGNMTATHANQSLPDMNQSTDMQRNISAAREAHHGPHLENQSASASINTSLAKSAADTLPVPRAGPFRSSTASVPGPVSNATESSAVLKSSAGWVGCWYYGCHQSYHPTFYCQCNPSCRRYGNCCFDFSRRCWYLINDRRRRAPPPDDRRRRTPPPDDRRRRTPAPPPQADGLVTVFHQTSPEACQAIVKSSFRPGSDGWCGGAIYFALSPEATKTKAIADDSKTGCVIEAGVDVGRVSYQGGDCGHKWEKQEFLQTGYDSIRFDPGDGPEVVIFDSWRVKRMRIIPYNNAWRPTYNVR